MICRDFRCLKCNAEYEVIFQAARDATDTLACDKCGGTARHIWKSFGPKGRVGGEKGRYPRYEIQAGRVFQSAREEKQYLKEKGLVQMGPDEYRRTQSMPGSPEPDVDIDREKLRECMKDAWEETVVHGKHYQHKIMGPGFKWVGPEKEDSSG